MLKTVTFVSNGNRVAKIFNPDLIDRDVTVIGLTLDIFHKCIEISIPQAGVSQYFSAIFLMDRME